MLYHRVANNDETVCPTYRKRTLFTIQQYRIEVCLKEAGAIVTHAGRFGKSRISACFSESAVPYLNSTKKKRKPSWVVDMGATMSNTSRAPKPPAVYRLGTDDSTLTKLNTHQVMDMRPATKIEKLGGSSLRTVIRRTLAWCSFSSGYRRYESVLQNVAGKSTVHSSCDQPLPHDARRDDACLGFQL